MTVITAPCAYGCANVICAQFGCQNASRYRPVTIPAQGCICPPTSERILAGDGDDYDCVQSARLALNKGIELGRAQMREEAAKVALAEKVSAEDTGHEGDRAYNLACDHIAQAIRSIEL